MVEGCDTYVEDAVAVAAVVAVVVVVDTDVGGLGVHNLLNPVRWEKGQHKLVVVPVGNSMEKVLEAVLAHH